MKRYFVTSSGTDAGKTLFTAALARQFHNAGKKVKVLKPVATGMDKRHWLPADSDAAVLMESLDIRPSQQAIEEMILYRLEAPISPDMAAALERKYIMLKDIVNFCRKAEKGVTEKETPDILLVEGAGGVMTPLNDENTMLDLMKALGYPVVLVLGSYLGAISHGLTAYNAIKTAGLEIALVVVNASVSAPVKLTETAETFANFVKAPMVTVPRLKAAKHCWEHVPDLLHMIENYAELKQGQGK